MRYIGQKDGVGEDIFFLFFFFFLILCLGGEKVRDGKFNL